MSYIQLDHIAYTYPSGLAPVFEDLTLHLDTDWKLGIIGRNGMGKSTFFKLLAGEIASEGRISAERSFLRFPLPDPDETLSGYDFSTKYLDESSQWKVLREAHLLGLSEELLFRPIGTLSGGERTKLQLAVLFASDGFPLLDEPTDHLDAAGRAALARYLAAKRGFFLVSHDRTVLDGCCDHILCFEKTGATVTRGNYSVWKEEREKRERADSVKKEKLEKERTRLQEAARRISEWANTAEGEKFGTRNSGLRPDRGFVGASAARVMKRAVTTRDRTARAEEGIAELLKGYEEIETLRLFPEPFFRARLFSVSDLSVRYGEKYALRQFDFSMDGGERVALIGGNGTGKSTFLKVLAGKLTACGMLDLSPRLKISYVPQIALYEGTLADYAADYGIDEAYFKAILAKFGFSRRDFSRDMREMSEGQKKKAALARSLCERAHLYIWDEPLNYLDIASREQVEKAVLSSGASLLFVEHDAAFTAAVATRTVKFLPPNVEN